MKTSLIISDYKLPNQSVPFDTTDEPTLIQYNHPEAMVYITVHYWLCIFYGFAQMYNDVYPP